MLFAFNVSVNLHVMRPTAPGCRILCQGKRESHQQFWIPCVFSSQTRLAFNVIVNLNGSRPTTSTSLFFFKKKIAPQESCHIPRDRLHSVFQVQCVFGSQVTLHSHVMLPAPAGWSFFVPGKTRITGITGKFQSWNTGKG